MRMDHINNPATRGLPGHRQRIYKNYLYAFEFKDGWVKLGATGDPAQRAAYLERQRKQRITRAVAHPVVGRWVLAEKRLLERANAIATLAPGTGRELFATLKFGAASNLVRQIGARVHQYLRAA